MPLTLSSKRGEQIRIGDHIIIRVIEIRENQVRISIKAPSTVEVHREKVYQAIQAAKRRDGYGSADRIAEGKRSLAVVMGHHLPEPKGASDAHDN